MSIPTPDARLAVLLAALPPDFCREVASRLDTLRLQGGGDLAVTLRVEADGRMSGAVMRWFERRIGAGGAT